MARLTENELRQGYEAEGMSEAEQERALDAYEAANPDDESNDKPAPMTVDEIAVLWARIQAGAYASLLTRIVELVREVEARQ